MAVFQLWFIQGIRPVVGLLGHTVVLFLVFQGISILFSIVAVSVYNTGRSTQCSVTTQRGEMGREMGGGPRREGTYVYLWLIHLDVWQKPTQCCKTTIIKSYGNKVGVCQFFFIISIKHLNNQCTTLRSLKGKQKYYFEINEDTICQVL